MHTHPQIVTPKVAIVNHWPRKNAAEVTVTLGDRKLVTTFDADGITHSAISPNGSSLDFADYDTVFQAVQKGAFAK